MDIELQSKVLHLKSVMNRINDTSYAYSQISRNFPYQAATTNEDLEKIHKAYESLLLELISYLKTTNYANTNLT